MAPATVVTSTPLIAAPAAMTPVQRLTLAMAGQPSRWSRTSIAGSSTLGPASHDFLIVDDVEPSAALFDMTEDRRLVAVETTRAGRYLQVATAQAVDLPSVQFKQVQSFPLGPDALVLG